MHKQYFQIVSLKSINQKLLIKTFKKKDLKDRQNILIILKNKLYIFQDLVPSKYLSMEHSYFLSYNQIYGLNKIE